MKDLFWLNHASPKTPQSIIKAQMSQKSQEKEETDSQLSDFPIYSQFSPSSKSLKVPQKYYKHHLLQQKRLSLDSGYAESHKSDDSNENETEGKKLPVSSDM